MNLGTGGMDASIGAIAQSIAGFEAWGVNAKMLLSGQDEAKKYASALRTLYSSGGAASDERNLFERILAGQTNIAEDGTGDFGAQTTYDSGTGTHTITLGRDALSDGSRFGMNILLAHEAYRNGVDDGAEGQANETRSAVLGHIQAAGALGATYGLGALNGAQLDEVRALQAAYRGDSSAIAGILGSYDSSGDYWLVKLDGTIEDTIDRAFYREYIDADGNVRREKVEGSEYEGSRGLALYNFLEDNMVDDMRGSHCETIDSFNPTVVKDVLGWDDMTLRLAIKDGVSISDLSPQLQQKLKIEQLLTKHGYTYSDEEGQWVGTGMKVAGLQQNESIGIRLVDGVWEKFTAGMTITRDADAYSVYRDGVASGSYDVIDSADVSFYKRDLDTGVTEIFHPDYAWASIDKTPGNPMTVGGHTYEGNTIVSEWFKMHLTGYVGDYGVSTVGVYTDAQILSGNMLNKGGWRSGLPREARWLMHPFGTNGTSNGCIGPMTNEGLPGWNNAGTVGQGAYNFQQMLNQFSVWGIYEGFEFSVHMLGQRRPR